VTRPHIPELLDAAGAPPQEVARALAGLRRYNRWLGGRRVLVGMVEREVRRLGLAAFSLLDVGAGSGDLPAAAARRFPSARLVVSDLKPHHLVRNGLPCLAAAAEALPFRGRSFDFVAASLLLHQFRDPEVVRLLEAFGRLARRAVLVSELERHWFPLWFVRLTAPALAPSPLARHDGAASVRQAFRPGELKELACRAGFARVEVRRHRPWFRLSLVASHE